jgi:hypothetical protein
MNAPATPTAAGTATASAAAVLEAEMAAFDALACSFRLLMLAAISLVTAGADPVTSAIWLERLSMTVDSEVADALSVWPARSEDRSSMALERPSTCVEMSESVAAIVDVASRMTLVGGFSVWRVASCATAPAMRARSAVIEGRHYVCGMSVMNFKIVLSNELWRVNGVHKHSRDVSHGLSLSADRSHFYSFATIMKRARDCPRTCAANRCLF